MIRLACLLALAALPCAAYADDLAALKQQVMDTERAFAKTMADRDFKAFGGFVADEAVFVGGKTQHGKAEVLATWKRLYDKPQAPFSWQPETVEVLESGKLALSRGPVFDAAGKPAGRFNSVWRLDAPGAWHIVFDFGEEACDVSTK